MALIRTGPLKQGSKDFKSPPKPFARHGQVGGRLLTEKVVLRFATRGAFGAGALDKLGRPFLGPMAATHDARAPFGRYEPLGKIGEGMYGVV